MSYSAVGQAGVVAQQDLSLPGGVPVPYVTKYGKSGQAVCGVGQNCGNAFGLQQMLKDLGYSLDVDGVVGPNTQAALIDYSVFRGIPFTPGSVPSGAICAGIEADWVTLKGGGQPPPQPSIPSLPNLPSVCPPGQTFNVSTLQCVPDSTPVPDQPPVPSMTCPDGTMNNYPACLLPPGWELPTKCPDGTMNNYPACLAAKPPSGTCPEGTEGTFPNCVPTKKPVPQPETPAPSATAESGMSTGTKVAIGVAVVGTVGALALILTAKPKKATPNRRRKA